ncbi:MAG: OsmC family protein [Simkaniaceae bacterium]
MKRTQKVNGVDIQALKDTCALLRQNPEMGQSKFRITNHWKDGGNNQAAVKEFYAAGEEQNHGTSFSFEADEPPVLLGGDQGASPVEYLLAALSSCMTTSIVYHAATRGYRIESLESEFEGDLDLRGFLQVSEDVPKGYQKIRATFKVKTDATEEEIAELYQFSPVYSMVSKSVPIEVKIVKI